MKYLVFCILIVPLIIINVLIQKQGDVFASSWSAFWIGFALMLVLSDIFPE